MCKLETAYKQIVGLRVPKGSFWLFIIATNLIFGHPYNNLFLKSAVISEDNSLERQINSLIFRISKIPA